MTWSRQYEVASGCVLQTKIPPRVTKFPSEGVLIKAVLTSGVRDYLHLDDGFEG